LRKELELMFIRLEEFLLFFWMVTMTGTTWQSMDLCWQHEKVWKLLYRRIVVGGAAKGQNQRFRSLT